MMTENNVRLTGPQLVQLANQERNALEQVNRKISTFQNFRNELRGAIDALTELGKTEKPKIMVNLGAGVYAEATIENTKTATTSITGNVFKDKPFKEVKETLEKKIKNVEKTLDKAGEEQQKILSRLNQLEQIMEAGRQHMQKQAQKK